MTAGKNWQCWRRLTKGFGVALVRVVETEKPRTKRSEGPTRARSSNNEMIRKSILRSSRRGLRDGFLAVVIVVMTAAGMIQQACPNKGKKRRKDPCDVGGWLCAGGEGGVRIRWIKPSGRSLNHQPASQRQQPMVEQQSIKAVAVRAILRASRRACFIGYNNNDSGVFITLEN